MKEIVSDSDNQSRQGKVNLKSTLVRDYFNLEGKGREEKVLAIFAITFKVSATPKQKF